MTTECHCFAHMRAQRVFSNGRSDCPSRHPVVVDPNPTLVKFKYRAGPNFGNYSKMINVQPRGVSPMLFLQYDKISVGVVVGKMLN